MRKLFSLIAAVLFAGSMMAQVTITPGDFTETTSADYSTVKEGVTVAVTASTVTADQIRIFKTQTITISAASNITSIVFTCTANGTTKYGPGCFAAQEGYTYEAEGKTGTWKGSATSVTFTASTNQVRATQIVVTLEGGEVPPVEPTVNYYVAGSMNGWAANADYMLTPSNNGEYKGEFTFAANDEFKVIGVEGETITWYPAGMNNNFQITQAGDYKIFFNPAGNVDGWYEGYFNVLMKEEPVVTAITCLDVYQKAKGDVVDLLNDVVVTFANGKNVWVRDASASMLIYLPAEGSYKAGDVLSGVAGTVDIYNGVHEIKPSADQVAAIVATAGEAPAAIPASVLEVADVNKYIVMQNVAAEGTFEEGKQSNLTINGVAVRNQFKNGYTFEAGKSYNIYGVVTIYQNNPQVYFITAEVAGGVTPGAEVEITIADGSFSDYVEYYGYWVVEAQNADYYISLSNDNTQIAQAAGTYTAADLYAADSYILTETDSISFVSGSIVLAVDAEGVATVTGSLVGNDGNTYILNIACPAPDEHEYDDDSDFIRNFSAYTINTDYLSEYGDIYVEASDADGYQITLDLYVPAGASGLVAGTYEINSTYEAGTVAAGVFDDGSIYPSFAGKGTSEGLENVWYLVSGTVVVDANLNITVNAVNSLSHTIKVTLSAGSQTGIEETLAAGKAAKVVRNGQVRILKAEKTFDVTGARIR